MILVPYPTLLKASHTEARTQWTPVFLVWLVAHYSARCALLQGETCGPWSERRAANMQDELVELIEEWFGAINHVYEANSHNHI